NVNIIIVKDRMKDFFAKIPKLEEKIKERFADYALEQAMIEARNYPPQMQDLIISWSAGGFIGNRVALMTMDILYGNGTFKTLTDRERITSNLLMFSDILPVSE
ncbi:MAG: hypothetical protein ACI4QR_04590, partial [Eubacteriales bacterium]